MVFIFIFLNSRSLEDITSNGFPARKTVATCRVPSGHGGVGGEGGGKSCIVLSRHFHFKRQLGWHLEWIPVRSGAGPGQGGEQLPVSEGGSGWRERCGNRARRCPVEGLSLSWRPSPIAETQCLVHWQRENDPVVFCFAKRVGFLRK